MNNSDINPVDETGDAPEALKDAHSSISEDSKNKEESQGYKLLRIAETGGEEEIGFISSFLSSENDRERCYAIEALKLIGSPEAIKKIASAVSDSSWKVRKIAFEYLLKLGPAGIKKLVRELPHEKPEDKKIITILSDFAGSIEGITKKGPRVDVRNSYNIEVRSLATSGRTESMTVNSYTSYISRLFLFLFLPFRFILKHIWIFSIIAVFLLLVSLAYMEPGFIPGKPWFEKLEKKETALFADLLERTRGMSLKKNRLDTSETCILLEKYWFTEILPEKILPVSVLFIAEEKNKSELYRASVVFRNRLPDSIKKIENISNTPDSDEKELIPLEDRYGILASLATGETIFKITDGYYERMFLFKQGLRVLEIIPSCKAFMDTVIVSFQSGREKHRILLNCTNGLSIPDIEGMEFIDCSSGREGFISRMVETIRQISWIGPEGIAWLEDTYYGIKDRFRRGLYYLFGTEEESIDTLTEEENPGEEEISELAKACSSIPEELKNQIRRIGSIETTDSAGFELILEAPAGPLTFEANAPSPENTPSSHAAEPSDGRRNGFKKSAPEESRTGFQLKTESDPSFSIKLMNGDLNISLIKADVLKPLLPEWKILNNTFLYSPEKSDRESLFKLFSSYLSKLEKIPELPPPLKPLLNDGKLPGEGIWEFAGDFRRYGFDTPFLKTVIRPDPERPYAKVSLVRIDTNRIDLHFVCGTEEPRSTSGIKGKGMIPAEEEVYRNLLASFNGGFRTVHGKYGAIENGVVFVKPLDGLATLVVYEDGAIDIGEWGTEIYPSDDILHLRQNLPLLVKKGKYNERNNFWGYTIDRKTHVWRSGIGITEDGSALLYAAGDSLTAETLARALIMAGAWNAMELDINYVHTYFYFYSLKKDRNGRIIPCPHKLDKNMDSGKNRGIRPYTRDFFYITRRVSPPGPVVDPDISEERADLNVYLKKK